MPPAVICFTGDLLHLTSQERFQVLLAYPPFPSDFQRRDELLVNHFSYLLLCGLQ